MQDIGVSDCPMPASFRESIIVPLFLGWMFYLGFVSRVIFAPLMPAIQTDLGITHGQAGSLFLMISIGYLAASFSSGLMAARLNHSGSLRVSAWLVALVLLPFSVAQNLWLLRALMMCIGLAAGFHLPSAVATITGQIRKEEWGKALSVHQSAPPLAFITAPLIATLLLAAVSWRWVLGLWGALAMVSALVYTVGGKGGNFPGQSPTRPNVSTVISKPSFWTLVVLFAMAMGGNAGIYAMLPLYLVTERGMELTRANTLVGLSQISGLAMVFIAGILVDKIGQKPMMAVTLLATGIFTILLGLAQGPWLYIVIFLQPALLNAFFPAGFGALARIAPPHLRSVSNALGTPLSFLFGGGLLPLAIGHLGERYSFSTGMICTGIFILAGPLLVPLLKLGQYDDAPGC